MPDPHLFHVIGPVIYRWLNNFPLYAIFKDDTILIKPNCSTRPFVITGLRVNLYMCTDVNMCNTMCLRQSLSTFLCMWLCEYNIELLSIDQTFSMCMSSWTTLKGVSSRLFIVTSEKIKPYFFKYPSLMDS